MNRQNTSKLLLLGALVVLLLIPSSLLGEVSSQQTVQFSRGELSFSKVEGYDLVTLTGCDYLLEVGRPMLPSLEVKVALPSGMEAKGIRVLGTVSEVIGGEYDIIPAQPPRTLNAGEGDAGLLEGDGAVYGSSQPYPADVVELLAQTDLAGQGMAVVRINPVQYVPALGKLSLYTSVSFVVEGVGGYGCGDYLPAFISEVGRTSYEKTLGDMVINPEEVKLVAGDPPLKSGVGPGDYDYVIITDDGWVDDFQPLADWKTKKGMAATIVTTDWIYNYGGYSGSTIQKIRAFVIDAHDTWGATFFLLGGDTGTIPYHTRYISGYSIANDTYYSDYDDDWTCEVHVGRASVTSTSAISTFIDKVFTYEQDPPLTSYAAKAGLFGFDLRSYGSGEGEGLMENIDDLIPSGWSVTKVYDSHSGNHWSNVISAMNAGQNLLAHMDHSSDDFMGTGYVNHGWGLDNGDMDGLYNGDKQSILYTGGCHACEYQVSACIVEHFVRNTNGGGVAGIGNSHYGWYEPYNPDAYSLLYERYFFRSLLEQDHYQLGDCFSDHKNDGPVSSSTYQFIFTTLTLLGDPELPIWTEDPTSLNVSHPSTLPTGPSTFTVHVEEAGGGNLSGALVCLWKGDEVYLTGTTNYSGDVTLNPSPSTTGTMYVTVSKHNYLPSQTEAEVTGGGTPIFYIDLEPDQTPVVVPRGGSFGFTGTVTNNTDQFQQVDIWLMAYVPGIGMYGPLRRFDNVPFSPYQVRSAHLNQSIPNNAPISDQYMYLGYVGYYPSTKIDSSGFPFEVTAKGLARAGASDWVLTGSFLEGDLTDLPSEFALLSNYPNPFNAQTVIEYQLPVSASVKLEVYNLLGSKVATLADGEQEAGYKSMTWDASEVSSGIYFYKLTAGDYSESRRMMLVK